MNEVITQAEKEFRDEQFRAAVEREKERLRRRANFWIRIFPWRLKVVRLMETYPDNEARIRYHVAALRKLGQPLTYKGGEVQVQNKRPYYFGAGL